MSTLWALSGMTCFGRVGIVDPRFDIVDFRVDIVDPRHSAARSLRGTVPALRTRATSTRARR